MTPEEAARRVCTLLYGSLGREWAERHDAERLALMRDLVRTAYSEGKAAGAEEMRERAATTADLFMFQTEGKASGQAYADVSPEIAQAIRALPLAAPPQPKGGEPSQIP